MTNRASIQNPNWPLIVAEYNPSGNYSFTSGSNAVWTDLTKRLIGAWGTARGRQFELDANQPGTWKGTWDNADGALDPTNVNSPLNTTLLPYRPYRLRAQLPLSVNRLTIDQATGGEGTPVGGQIDDASIISSAGPPNALFGPIGASSGHGGPFTSSWQGTQLWATQAAAGAAGVPFIINVPVSTGNTYSFSAYTSAVPRTAGTFGTVTVAMTVAWVGPNITTTYTAGTSVAMNTANPQTWTRLTATGTAPAGATMASVAIQITVAPTAGMWICSDGWQAELGPAPTAWTMPGVWYSIYNGAVERFPQVWTQGGSWGKVTPTAVDSFSLLAQTVFPDLIGAAVNAAAGPGIPPSFFYRLGDATGSTTFTDATGQRQAANGANGVVAGTAQTSTDPGWTPAATPRSPVATFASNYNPSSSQPLPRIDVPPDRNGVLGPPTSGGFTRMIAFKWTAGKTGVRTLWATTSGNPLNPARGYGFLLDANNHLWAGGGNNSALPSGTASISNWLYLGAPGAGDWHLAFLSVDSTGTQFTGALDGTSASGTGTAPPAGWSVNADTIGMFPDTFQDFPWQGDLALAAQWPVEFTTTQMYDLWTTWQFACAGESSGNRYTRILTYAGYQGESAIDLGSSQSLGPATDIAGQDALSALAAIVATENGQHFVDASGTITFYGRTRRYAANTPQVVFGENTSAGEIPYENLTFDFDPTRLANNVVITQQSTGTITTAVDRPSVQAYGTRTMQRSNQSSSLLEIRDASNWLLRRYKNPQLRITALTVRPTSAAAWTALLSLELGARIRVMRRPVGGTPITFDGFVERIAWNVDDQVNALVDLEVSPATATAVWNLAAMHTTLAQAAAAGDTVIWLPLPAGVTLSAFESQLAPGQTWQIGPNAGGEYVTVVGPSNATGNPLWAPVKITALASARPAGTRVTDNTQLLWSDDKFDAAAVLDSTTILAY
jgi:hypothetical protein